MNKNLFVFTTTFAIVLCYSNYLFGRNYSRLKEKKEEASKAIEHAEKKVAAIYYYVDKDKDDEISQSEVNRIFPHEDDQALGLELLTQATKELTEARMQQDFKDPGASLAAAQKANDAADRLLKMIENQKATWLEIQSARQAVERAWNVYEKKRNELSPESRELFKKEVERLKVLIDAAESGDFVSSPEIYNTEKKADRIAATIRILTQRPRRPFRRLTE